MHLMRLFYSIIYAILLPFIFLRLLWRSRKNPAYREHMLQRLAIYEKSPKQGGLWLHAVSVGETIAAIPLIKAFQATRPDCPITITNMTPTGMARAKAAFGDSVQCLFVPYDLAILIRRFCQQIKPDLLVIMETELWPNLLAVTKQLKIPSLLANARLSERSYLRYAKIKFFTKSMLNCFTKIAVQTQVEAERLVKLGASTQQIEVTGSIKFDINIPEDLVLKANELKSYLGRRTIWLAASTHPNEEDIILSAHTEIKKIIPDILLILVPRHPERFEQVKNLCEKHGFSVVKRTEQTTLTNTDDIFLGDTMGELLLFYAIADIAFVAGSLMPIGGHNLLEPAALAKPTITGWHMHNFTAITELLINANGLKQIHHKEELAIAVISLLQNPMIAKQMGEQALQVVLNNRGALQKHLEFILTLI